MKYDPTTTPSAHAFGETNRALIRAKGDLSAVKRRVRFHLENYRELHRRAALGAPDDARRDYHNAQMLRIAAEIEAL